MADQPPYPDTGDDTGVGPDRRSTTDTPPGMPGWVKVFGIITLVLVLLLVVVMVASGGGHGPGRHMPSGSPGGHTAPIQHGVQRG